MIGVGILIIVLGFAGFAVLQEQYDKGHLNLRIWRFIPILAVVLFWAYLVINSMK
jgi:hypothetical protein